MYTISKFDYDIRSQVIINCASNDDDNNNKKIDDKLIENGHHSNGKKITESTPKDTTKTANSTSTNGTNGTTETRTSDFHTLSLEELTVACGEKILNPDFLLHGGGVPFTDTDSVIDKNLDESIFIKQEEHTKIKIEEPDEIDDKLNSPKGEVFSPAGRSEISELSELTDEKNDQLDKDLSNDSNNNGRNVFDDYDLLMPKRPVIILTSQKMKGLKDLLLAEKLNTNAISLQITAQSQVHVGKKTRTSFGDADNYDNIPIRSKRSRRE